jgi:hypothetical protein
MGRRWIWTPAKEQALEGLALGYLSQRQVAESIGVTRRTLEGWMRRPIFRQRVERERAAYAQRVRAERAARFAAWMAEEDAREQAEEEAFAQRLAAVAGLHGTQRVRALRSLLH